MNAVNGGSCSSCPAFIVHLRMLHGPHACALAGCGRQFSVVRARVSKTLSRTLMVWDPPFYVVPEFGFLLLRIYMLRAATQAQLQNPGPPLQLGRFIPRGGHAEASDDPVLCVIYLILFNGV